MIIRSGKGSRQCPRFPGAVLLLHSDGQQFFPEVVSFSSQILNTLPQRGQLRSELRGQHGWWFHWAGLLGPSSTPPSMQEDDSLHRATGPFRGANYLVLWPKPRACTGHTSWHGQRTLDSTGHAVSAVVTEPGPKTRSKATFKPGTARSSSPRAAIAASNFPAKAWACEMAWSGSCETRWF